MDEQEELGSVKKCPILGHCVLFVCLFVYSVLQCQVIYSVSVINVTNPLCERRLVRRRKSLPEQTCRGRKCKKHRVIRQDIVNILQSLYPWAIAWTASHKVMVSYGNCRQSFWSQLYNISWRCVQDKFVRIRACLGFYLYPFPWVLFHWGMPALFTTCIFDANKPNLSPRGFSISLSWFCLDFEPF